MERKKFSSGAPWESKVGYSRGVQVGSIIELAGTTAVKDGEVVFEGDAYGQTKFILQLLADVLTNAGSSLKDVIRTRIYVTNIADFEAVGKAHGEFFSEIRPASTMVEVSALVDPKMLVEIEITAITD